MTTRRRFLTRGALMTAAAVPGVHLYSSARGEDDPRLDLELVFEMVRVSHSDIEAVRRLVEEEPALALACHDWGDGDFETALGAASHTGQKEIAHFLLDNGARINLFAATMLGEMDIVEAFLAYDPSLVHVAGPHGLSLLHHAEKGGTPQMIDLIKSHLNE